MIEAKRGGAVAEAASDLVRATADRPFAASRIVEVGPLTIAIHFADRDLEALFADAFYPAPATCGASWSVFVVAAGRGEPLPLPGFSANEPDMRLVESAERYCLWMGRHSPSLYVVDRPSRRAVCWVTEKSAVKAWERSRPFLPALQAMFDDSPWLAVHAAALALEDRAILFAGPGAPARPRSALPASAPAGGLSETITWLSTPANWRPPLRRCSRLRGCATTWSRAFRTSRERAPPFRTTSRNGATS